MFLEELEKMEERLVKERNDVQQQSKGAGAGEKSSAASKVSSVTAFIRYIPIFLINLSIYLSI